jgi:hypothetical protein
MSGFNGEKKDDDDDEMGGAYVHPFRGVDKAHIIQEARIFNDPSVEPWRSASNSFSVSQESRVLPGLRCSVEAR